MAKRLPAQVRDHLEWLGFIQPTGLVVSAHALVQAGAILNRGDIEGQRLLGECVEERCFRPGREPEPFLPDFEWFAGRVLGWRFSPKGYSGVDGCPIPPELELPLPEYNETLRPDFAVRELDPRDGCPPWQLLVQVAEPGTDLDRTAVGKGGLEASAHGRLERLLRGTRVPAGILFNGRVIRVVSAPRGESSGWMDFRVNDMLPTAGRPLCAALRLLLSETRLLALPKKQRLVGLLEASRKYQNVVSERLSDQVLQGLHELLRGFRSAHEKSQGKLLAHELEQDPDNVYRALLTVMLRLVFLLYAEERGMLSEDATFADHYSIGGLYERLREDAGLYPDTMDDRYGAWAQLLVLFRMVHDGAKSGGMRLPARRGELFSPSRFPFLEGWHGSGAPQVTQAIKAPLVPRWDGLPGPRQVAGARRGADLVPGARRGADRIRVRDDDGLPAGDRDGSLGGDQGAEEGRGVDGGRSGGAGGGGTGSAGEVGARPHGAEADAHRDQASQGGGRRDRAARGAREGGGHGGHARSRAARRDDPSAER